MARARRLLRGWLLPSLIVIASMNLAFEHGVQGDHAPVGPSVSVPHRDDGGVPAPGDEQSSGRAPAFVALLLPSLDPPSAPACGECEPRSSPGIAPALGHRRRLDRPPIAS